MNTLGWTAIVLVTIVLIGGAFASSLLPSAGYSPIMSMPIMPGTSVVNQAWVVTEYTFPVNNFTSSGIYSASTLMFTSYNGTPATGSRTGPFVANVTTFHSASYSTNITIGYDRYDFVPALILPYNDSGTLTNAVFLFSSSIPDFISQSYDHIFYCNNGTGTISLTNIEEFPLPEANMTVQPLGAYSGRNGALWYSSVNVTVSGVGIYPVGTIILPSDSYHGSIETGFHYQYSYALGSQAINTAPQNIWDQISNSLVLFVEWAYYAMEIIAYIGSLAVNFFILLTLIPGPMGVIISGTVATFTGLIIAIAVAEFIRGRSENKGGK